MNYKKLPVTCLSADRENKTVSIVSYRLAFAEALAQAGKKKEFLYLKEKLLLHNLSVIHFVHGYFIQLHSACTFHSYIHAHSN